MLNANFLQKGTYCWLYRQYRHLYQWSSYLRPIDSTDSTNTTIIFKDPTVTFAITETPVESILEYGIGYKWASTGIFLNIEDQEIYYTYDHIRDLEDVAYAKSVVLTKLNSKGQPYLMLMNINNGSSGKN
jgi:hypothetical protein